MVMERLESELRATGNPADKEFADVVSAMRKSRGEDFALEKQAIISPENKLQKEWNRQANKLAKLFARELGMTKDQYIASLPKLDPQPTEFKGRLDTFTIADGRIPVERQCELAGITCSPSEHDGGDWKDDPKQYTTPKKPYIFWSDMGARHMEEKVVDVRRELADDERGGTELDGVALYIARPGILKRHYLDLPGTTVGSNFAACMRLWDEKPELHANHIDYVASLFGSLVCGRQK
jgi:hypothetical protein